MNTHRFSKGYTHILDSVTLQPYQGYLGSPAIIHDLALIEAILALPSSFIPSENVTIDWGYGLTTTMPAGYGNLGLFNGISIDIHQRRVHLNSVSSDSNGSLFTYFADGSIIESVIIDNASPYFSFINNTLSCEEGTHAYTITYTEPPNWNYTTIINTFPTITPTTTSIPTSYSSSTNLSTSKPSQPTSTTTITNQTTGFLSTILPINLISIALILTIRRKRKK
jgi:hypothetical protein